MKQILLLIALLFSYNSFSQTTIYSESCGTPTAVTSVATYTGWQNYGTQTYSGNADVRTTVPSSGYTGASGGGNIFITSTANTNCTISGISTIGYNNICLQFGILKTTNASNGSHLAVEYSTDGTNWTALSFTMGTGAGSSNVWYYIQPSCSACGTTGLPSVNNLRLRFRMNTVATGLQFRIDDIKVIGTPNVILPLTLISFVANVNANKTTLHWITASEENIVKFVVEKSTNLLDWKDVGEVKAVGGLFKEQYQFVDDINNPINYYRLRIIEYYTDYYSQVVYVVMHNQPKQIYYYDLNGEKVLGEL